MFADVVPHKVNSSLAAMFVMDSEHHMYLGRSPGEAYTSVVAMECYVPFDVMCAVCIAMSSVYCGVMYHACRV